MSTYTTKQGDMWDNIAYTQLGSCDYTGTLLAINSKYVSTYVFPSGIELELPGEGLEETTSNNAPPWKVTEG